MVDYIVGIFFKTLISSKCTSQLCYHFKHEFSFKAHCDEVVMILSPPTSVLVFQGAVQ